VETFISRKFNMVMRKIVENKQWIRKLSMKTSDTELHDIYH
jgi:hypothetical protein